MKSFTVEEIREIFENIIINNDKQMATYYVDLEGKYHYMANMSHAKEFMGLFLKDLYLIAEDRYDKKGNRISNKHINDYDCLGDALAAFKKPVNSLILLETGDNSSIIHNAINAFEFDNTKDNLKDKVAAIKTISRKFSRSSYYIDYDENDRSMVIICH